MASSACSDRRAFSSWAALACVRGRRPRRGLADVRDAACQTGRTRADRAGRYRAMDAAPEIGLIGEVESRDLKAVGDSRSPVSRSGDRRARRHGGIERGSRRANGVFSGPILRFGRQHVLVRDADPFLERIERRIAIDLPPVAAQRAVVRLRFLPAGGRSLLKCRRGGTLVLGSNHARARRQRQRHGKRRAASRN